MCKSQWFSMVILIRSSLLLELWRKMCLIVTSLMSQFKNLKCSPFDFGWNLTRTWSWDSHIQPLFYSPRVAAQDLFEEQRGTLGHILVELTEVKLGCLDSGLCLSRVILCKRQSPTEPEWCTAWQKLRVIH